jgi:hypothetical protein
MARSSEYQALLPIRGQDPERAEGQPAEQVLTTRSRSIVQVLGAGPAAPSTWARLRYGGFS